MDGIQLKYDILLGREDGNISNFERVDEEMTFRNELGESQLGSISTPITPSQILVLAKVALALSKRRCCS